MNKKTLTVAFDAKRAVANDTGLGNYSRRVIDEISALRPSWRLLLFAPKKRQQPRLEPLLERDGVEIRTPATGLWRRVSGLWRVWRGLTRDVARSGADLFHGLSNELPLDILRAGIPTVVTIHDLIFRRCPDNYKAIDRKIYDYKFRKAAEHATRVIAISERTKADIVDLYGVDPGKIDVVYQSCAPQFSEPVSEDVKAEVCRAYSLPERYIALVGTLERRKNAMLAVEALVEIDPEVSLVLVGRSRQGYGDEVMRRARELGVEQRVKHIEGVPFAHLPAIYAMAQVAAYPSRYEGFGLPVVEAISAGTPVVAATGSCLEEAGGEGAIYVDPDNARAFAEAANKMLANAALRQEMVAKGRQHIAHTLSTPMGEAILKVYSKALSRPL